MSSPDITGILETSKDLDRLRREQDEILQEINKLHKKLQSGASLKPDLYLDAPPLHRSFVVECAKFCILSHINLIRASLDSRYDWWVLFYNALFFLHMYMFMNCERKGKKKKRIFLGSDVLVTGSYF